MPQTRLVTLPLLLLSPLSVGLLSACSDSKDDTADAATIELSISLSEHVQTVGVAQWSLKGSDDTLSKLTVGSLRAEVVYGPDAKHLSGRAPADLSKDEPGDTIRTTLLGLQPGTEYVVQVVVSTDDDEIKSELVSFTSGELPNGGPSIDRRIHETGASKGYTVACSAGADQPNAFIFDNEGTLVWLYSLTGTNITSCSRARMSYDAKYVWLGSLGDALLRVAIDGSEQRAYTLPFRHHDFAVLPNGNLVYFSRASADLGPDTIYEFDPETEESTVIYDQSVTFGFDERGTHTNYITFVPELSAISFSMRELNSIGLVSYPEGELLAVFGGDTSDFDGMSWSVQHGHVVTPERLVVFNNSGKLANAAILAFDYDLEDKSWQETFRFDANFASVVLGDVVELPSGNLLVSYSAAGVFQELDASGTIVQEFRTVPVGYFEHRKSLYGPPPPFDRGE